MWVAEFCPPKNALLEQDYHPVGKGFVTTRSMRSARWFAKKWVPANKILYSHLIARGLYGLQVRIAPGNLQVQWIISIREPDFEELVEYAGR